MIVRMNISIPDELRRRAKAAAALRNETISEVVRKALETYVARTLDEADLENKRDFEILLASPDPDAMSEEEAIELAVGEKRAYRAEKRAQRESGN